MDKKTLVVIDPETTILRALQDKLDDIGIPDTYSVAVIQPWSSSVREILEQVAEEVNQLKQNDEKIEAVFIDVVMLEGIEPGDRSGIDVAKLIRKMLPGIPIIAITHYEKSYSLISGITFESCFDGLMLKIYLLGKDITKQDLLDYIEKAKKKALIAAQARNNLGG